MPAPFRGPRAQLHAGLLGLHQLRRCLYGLGGVPCFVLHQHAESGLIDWWELLTDDRRLRPFDFEFQLGLAATRDDYHARNLEQLRRTRCHTVGTLFGFSDLYVPLAIGTTDTLVFYAGQWTPCVPSYELIHHQWQKLSGREPVPSDPLFRRWVRVCLEVPVLRREQLDGLIRLGESLAQLGEGATLASTQRAVDLLRLAVFAPHATDHNWVGSAVDVEGLTRPPWGLDAHLDPRLVDELRLTLRPSSVALLAVDRRQHRAPPLEEQVVARRLQHEATRLSRQLPNCVAGPLGDSGVIVALSLEAGVRGKQRQRRFERLVRTLQRLLVREGQLSAVAGLGLEVVPGEGLGGSYRQAAVALAAAIHAHASLLTYAAEMDTEGLTVRGLRALGESLLTLLAQRRFSELSVEGARFARSVLAQAGAHSEGMRPYLLWTLDGAVTHLAAEGVLTEVRARELFERIEAEVSRVAHPFALVDCFEVELENLTEVMARHGVADRDERFRSALEWVQTHLDATSPLEEAARRAGLAPPSFRRAFRRARGQSFGRWLRQARLDAARVLLSHSDLPVANVARCVGFGEAHAFIRNFRRAYSITPGAFRRRALALPHGASR